MSCDHNIIIIKETIQTWLFIIKYSNLHKRLKKSFYLTVDMLKLTSLITTEIFFTEAQQILKKLRRRFYLKGVWMQ